jgi:hypothetical protein
MLYARKYSDIDMQLTAVYGMEDVMMLGTFLSFPELNTAESISMK